MAWIWPTTKRVFIVVSRATGHVTAIALEDRERRVDGQAVLFGKLTFTTDPALAGIVNKPIAVYRSEEVELRRAAVVQDVPVDGRFVTISIGSIVREGLAGNRHYLTFLPEAGPDSMVYVAVSSDLSMQCAVATTSRDGVRFFISCGHRGNVEALPAAFAVAEVDMPPPTHVIAFAETFPTPVAIVSGQFVYTGHSLGPWRLYRFVPGLSRELLRDVLDGAYLVHALMKLKERFPDVQVVPDKVRERLERLGGSLGALIEELDRVKEENAELRRRLVEALVTAETAPARLAAEAAEEARRRFGIDIWAFRRAREVARL